MEIGQRSCTIFTLQSVFSSIKMKGITHAIQEVTPAETGVRDRPYKHTYTYTQTGECSMTTLIMTADKIGLHSLAEWFKKFARELEHARKVRSTIKELSKLTDRELNDIGIARGDIYAIAHEDTDYARFADTNKNLKGWV